MSKFVLGRCIVVMLALMCNGTAGSASPLDDSSVDDNNRFPDAVNPGQTVTITGKFDSKTQNEKPVVRLHLVGSEATTDQIGGSQASVQVTVGLPTTNQFTATLPERIAPGRYYLTVDYDTIRNKVIPSELRVLANGVQLDAAHPTTAYQQQNGKYNFDIVGQNFSPIPQDDHVYISGQGEIIKSVAPTESGCDQAASPCLWVDTSLSGGPPPDKLHVVGYQAENFQGSLMLSVIVGTGARSNEKQLVLSRMSETQVLCWSIGAFLILAYVIYRLVARGMKDYVIDGKHFSPFWSFFIDEETNSYSLSKFQFFMFASAFLFGYIYVFLCSWLVQWHFVLPDVPTNFSGILAMSAGTTVVAAGATSGRGSKGAGPLLPSAADFISTGGQVVPERFQFFVWTLISCFGFVCLLVSQNPATLNGFPDFPSGLLYVMGVSSGGYLGGKLIRSAGPVLRNIAWDEANSEITVQGENLSSDADFFIDGIKLPIVPNTPQKLVTATPQDQASDPTFSTLLKIKIETQAKIPDLSTGDHVFRIVNKDAQFADIRFSSDSPVISGVEMVDQTTPLSVPTGATANMLVASGESAVQVKVIGSDFRMGMTAKWKGVDARDPVDLAASAVTFIDSQNLTVTLVPGGKGAGAVLMLLTPKGFVASATVTVA